MPFLEATIYKDAPQLQEPKFLAAPVDRQIEFLNNDFLPAVDPDFASAGPAEREDYIKTQVLPLLAQPKLQRSAVNTQEIMNPTGAPQRMNAPNPLTGFVQQVEQFRQNPLVQGLERARDIYQYGNSRLADSFLLDYSQFAKGQEAAQPFLKDDPIAQAYGNAGSLVGNLLPFILGGGAVSAGAKGLGRAALPYTSNIARAAVPGIKTALARPAVKAASLLQSSSLPARIIKDAALFGGVEALKSNPENQLDFGKRIQNAGTGALTGAAFPIATNLGGKVLKFGASIFKPATGPIGLNGIKSQNIKAVSKVSQDEMVKLFYNIQRLLTDIRDGIHLMPDMKPKEYAQIVKTLDRIQKSLKSGKTIIKPKELKYIDRLVNNKRLQAMVKTRKAEGYKPQTKETLEQAKARISAKETSKNIEERIGKKQLQSKAEVNVDEADLKANTPEAKVQEPEYETVEVTKKVKRKVTRPKPEVQAQIDKIKKELTDDKKHFENRAKGAARSLDEYELKTLKGRALSAAAEIRKLIQGESLEEVEGGLTGKELQTLINRMEGNYIGKPVLANGQKGKVVGNSFGKVRVQIKGEIRSFEPKEITPQPVPKGESGLITQEVEVEVTEYVQRLKEKPKEKAEPLSPRKEHAQLTGTVTEMVDQGLEGTGLTYKEAKAAHAEIQELGSAESDPRIIKIKDQKRELGQGRDAETKAKRAKLDAKIEEIKQERNEVRSQLDGIHPNVREVLGTDWDGKSPTATQLPVNEKQLTRDQIEGIVTEEKTQKVLDKIDEAMRNGNSVRLEYAAEETGRTGGIEAAATLTKSGNVKTKVSTFTPTHYTEVIKDGKKYVTVQGYREGGEIGHYYLTESPKGSVIQKVVKVLDTEHTVGVHPNVYLGPRKFKVADVLKREVTSEGPIKTSEAISVIQEATQNLDKVFKLADDTSISKNLRDDLKKLQAKESWNASDIKKFQRIVQDKKVLPIVCNTLGLTHGGM